MFTAEMFNKTNLSGKGEYVIGFSRIYKNIEHSWKDWVIEFESIIRLMKWDSVNIFLETEMFGTHQYMWMNKYYPNGSKRDNSYELFEKDEWYLVKDSGIFGACLKLNLALINLKTKSEH